MRSVLRLVVTVVLLALAAAFAGSVFCPPAHERDSIPAAAERYREAPSPGRLEGEAEPDRAVVTKGPSAAPASVERPGVLRVRVTDPDGAPVDLAEVFVAWAERDGAPPALHGITDGDGLWSHESMPFAAFEVHAVKDGWFPSEKVVVAFRGGEEEEVHLVVRPGGTVEGLLYGMDGRPASSGWIRFTQLDTGEVRLTKPDVRGSFHSGPLTRGAWKLEWLDRQGGEPLREVAWVAAVEPGAHYRVEVTLPRPEDRATWLEGRTPGVRVLP